jgi:hypothetical protein
MHLIAFTSVSTLDHKRWFVMSGLCRTVRENEQVLQIQTNLVARSQSRIKAIFYYSVKMRPKLVPELICSNIEKSAQFYVGLLGFRVLYARPEERFLF